MIRFTNEAAKIYLARKGPASVFGRDVDTREALSQPQAVALFDHIWADKLQREVEQAPKCSLESVLERLYESAKSRVKRSTEHREFRTANCLFIAQLPSPMECDELWFVSSSSADPRTLYVNFDTVLERDEFRLVASQHGWDEQELALELLRDFARKDRRRKTGGRRAEHGAAPDCLQPTLLRRSGFRQQVSPSVRLSNTWAFQGRDSSPKEGSALCSIYGFMPGRMEHRTLRT
jgi:hypothetical protein